MIRPSLLLLPAILAALSLASGAAASSLPVYALTIKDHLFRPDVLTIPAGTKVQIRVHNEDPTPEEFESTDFNREIIVLPHGSVTVYVGPLHAGTYGFFGDFHPGTAQGRLLVK